MDILIHADRLNLEIPVLDLKYLILKKIQVDFTGYMSQKISTIMPLWVINEELYELTRNTLPTVLSDELILVDNASTIGADQFLMNSDIYIRNKINLGYPKAVNQGVALAHGDLIAIANNDIRVSPNWKEIAEEVFEKLPKAGSLHFKMVEYNAPFNLGTEVWDHGKELWCHGSFFVIRREAWVGIDENFGLGGYDDYDWQLRMREKGWKTVYTNGAAFQHKDSSSQLLRDPQERTETDRKNYEYFKKKHGEYPDKMWQRLYPKQFERGWLPFP